jgi:hypothetical protein
MDVAPPTISFLSKQAPALQHKPRVVCGSTLIGLLTFFSFSHWTLSSMSAKLCPFYSPKYCPGPNTLPEASQGLMKYLLIK